MFVLHIVVHIKHMILWYNHTAFDPINVFLMLNMSTQTVIHHTSNTSLHYLVKSVQQLYDFR